MNDPQSNDLAPPHPLAEVEDDDAAEVLQADGRGPFVWTCEHASNRLVGVEADEDDEVLLDDHWGWDLGAAHLVHALSARTDSTAVLSRFSRLIIDPNRDLMEPDLIPEQTLDGPVSFNQLLSEEDRELRIDKLWGGYHRTLDRTVGARIARGPVHLVSIHSFTPMFAGHSRPMEVGVLFDEHEGWAHKVAEAIGAAGFEVALNEPYSGKTGLMYSVARHGRAHDADHLELEVRNDLLRSAADIEKMADRLREALKVFEPQGT